MPRGRDAIRRKLRFPFAPQDLSLRAEQVERGSEETTAPGLDEVAPSIGDHLSERRKMTRKARHDHTRHAEFFGDQKSMRHWPCSAERDESKVARIEAAVDGNLPHGASHLRYCDSDRGIS